MASLPPDPYKVLGVVSDASLPEIRAAHRKLVLKCHPDKVQDPVLKAAKFYEFRTVQQAYELLMNETSRARYDDLVKREHLRSAMPAKTAAHETINAYTVRTASPRVADDPPRASTSSKSRRAKAEVDTEREEFISFALKLFDQAKKDGKNSSSHSATDGVDTISGAGDSSKARERSTTIEEEIRLRNKASKTLKKSTNPLQGPEERLEEAVKANSTAEAQSASEQTKRDKLYAVPAEQLNLEVLSPIDDEGLVDIVAVHGLGAIPDITWKEKTSGINWLSHPEMLPKAVPAARILRFGYDSLWMGETPIRTSLSTIAYKLLLSLSTIRVANLDKPLVFIGHCFGGLVIERALNLAKMRQEKYPGLFNSSVGVVFLGTPHRGSRSFTRESALLAAIAASSDLSQHLETGVLDTMTSDTGSLLDVADDFVTLCTDNGPMISCFFEQRSSKLGKVINRNDIDEFIVDSTSATFDGHPKYGLEVDHFGLNKFDGPRNPSFIQVRAEIVRFYTTALARAASKAVPSISMQFKQHIPGVDNENLASSKKLDLSQRWNQMGRSTAASKPSSSRDTKSKANQQRFEPGVSHNRSASFSGSTVSLNPDSDMESMILQEEDLRKEANRELRREEVRKNAALREEEYSKRAAEEKALAERAYLDRIKKNMEKYGVDDAEAILDANPLPKDETLSKQEVKDKNAWHLNRLKGALLDKGVNGGQVDEILNDKGETAIIDGVETTVTRMSRKWISTRTLDAYDIPWQRDKDDRYTIIVKRWVPDYEQAFLWDHTEALRGGRGRKRQRMAERKETRTEEKPEKDWVLKMWESFKTTQKKYSRKTSEYANTDDRERRRSRERGYNVKSPGHKSPFSDYEYEDMPPRRSRRDGTNPASPVPYHQSGRKASAESMRSAPDSEEVARRRRNSRTLSGDRASSRRGSVDHPRTYYRADSREDLRSGLRGEPSRRRRGSYSNEDVGASTYSRGYERPRSAGIDGSKARYMW